MATYAKSLPEVRTLPWSSLLWFGALLIACYAPVLYWLGYQWATDADMGHGFFVPAVAGYIVWQRRALLATVEVKQNAWGLVLVVWGAMQMLLGTLGAEIFLARTAFLVSLTGAILFLGGIKVLRIVAFPLFLLCFMIPLPAIIYARITLPLQIFASSVAETILGLVDIPVLRDGNVLTLANQQLDVAEACSGIRSLLTLSFLSLVYAYFFDRKPWMRWVMLAATIPIAIAANAGRVTITGIISNYRPDLAQGFFHTLEGWVLFIVACTLMVGFHWAANRVYAMRRARG